MNTRSGNEYQTQNTQSGYTTGQGLRNTVDTTRAELDSGEHQAGLAHEHHQHDTAKPGSTGTSFTGNRGQYDTTQSGTSDTGLAGGRSRYGDTTSGPTDTGVTGDNRAPYDSMIGNEAPGTGGLASHRHGGLSNVGTDNRYEQTSSMGLTGHTTQHQGDHSGAKATGVLGAGSGATGEAASSHSPASHTGTPGTGGGPHKATIGEKIKGTVEEIAGKITNDPERVQTGEQLKTGSHPSQTHNIYGTGNARATSNSGTATGGSTGRSGV